MTIQMFCEIQLNMIKAFLITTSLILVGSIAHANRVNGCPTAKFANPSEISSAGSSTILITHPSSDFDFSLSAKDGVDRLTKLPKTLGATSIFLQNSNFSNVYTSNCEPDFWVYSQAGEFSFRLTSETVYFGGGYWEACQDSTFSDVLRSWAVFRPKVARLIQVMDAIYVSGTYIYPWDEFYYRYQTLLDGKPSVFPNSPTVTLSELMGVMLNDEQRIEMLSRNLPNFGYIPADVEIQLFYNGTFVKQLQAASSSTSQRLLRLEFVETAQ